MDMLGWLAILILFIMVLSTKSRLTYLQNQIDELVGKTKIVANQVWEEKCTAEEPIVEKNISMPTAQAQQTAKVATDDTITDYLPNNEDKVSFLGQKLITWIAGLAATLGAFYFVKYSIENGLLGPIARLSLTVLFGLAAMVYGTWLYYKKEIANHERIGEALIGAGVSALYFAAYALSKIYDFAPASVSFGLMCIITAATVFLTLRSNSQTIAILALIGGFMTPALVGQNSGNVIAFTLYLFVISFALLFIASRMASLLLLTFVLLGLYGWILFWMIGTYHFGDSFWILLLAFGITTSVIRLFPASDKAEYKLLRTLSFVMCGIFAFGFLIKTNFGMLEWGWLAVLVAGLTFLAYKNSKNYMPLLLGSLMVVFCFIFAWRTHEPYTRQWIFSGFAVLSWLPFYISLWFSRQTNRLAFATITPPLFYALYYLTFNDDNILPYIGLIIAVIISLPLLKLNFHDVDDNEQIGMMILSSASLITMALATIIQVDFWPMMLAIEILLLGALIARFDIRRLDWGLKAGWLLFWLTQIENVFYVIKIVLYGSLTRTRFSADYLSEQFYISYVIVPVLAFVTLAWVARKSSIKIPAVASASIIAGAGLFSFYMLIRMKFEMVSTLVPSFADNALLNNLLLLGALIPLYYKKHNLGMILMLLGIWRLVGIGIILSCPLFIHTETSIASIMFAYGVPTFLFAFYAWKSPTLTRQKYILCSAAMSFVLVSALLTQAFYNTLYLNDIYLTNGGIFAYSIAWLLLGCLWLAVAFNNPAMVKPAFGLIYFVVAKVFVFDVSSLGGIWRVGALFALAGTLLGISYFYTKYFQIKLEKS